MTRNEAVKKIMDAVDKYDDGELSRAGLAMLVEHVVIEYGETAFIDEDDDLFGEDEYEVEFEDEDEDDDDLEETEH